MTLQVSSHVMDIAAHEVTQTMGLEQAASQVDCHHIVHTASEQASSCQVL